MENIALERWFMFFADMCKTASRLGYGIACHPKQKGPMTDMMERLGEDDLWRGMGDLPPLVVHFAVPEGQYMFVNTETMQTIRNKAAVKSRLGLGRFTELYTPDAAIKKLKA